MPRKLYNLWPTIQAKLPLAAYNRLRTFYNGTRYKVTPESLGKYNWYAVIEALAFYEEHKRPMSSRDDELIAAYEAYLGMEVA